MDYLKRLKGGRCIRYRLEVILALFILAKLILLAKSMVG